MANQPVQRTWEDSGDNIISEGVLRGKTIYYRADADYLNFLETENKELKALVEEVVAHMDEADRDHCELQDEGAASWLSRARKLTGGKDD